MSNIKRQCYYDLSYISSHKYMLYRWGCLSAFSSNRPQCRVFYSMCKLGHHVYGPDRYFLIQILVTLCSEFRIRFMMHNNAIKQTRIFTEFDFVKKFWCLTNDKVSTKERDYYEKERDMYCKL